MILRQIRAILRRLTGPTVDSVPRTQKDGTFVADAVSSYLNEHNASGGRLPLDGEYFLTSRDEMDKIINGDDTLMNLYASSEYDCENFAITFMNYVQKNYGINGVGIVVDWSGTHAYNLIVHEDGSVSLYEPQEGHYVDPGKRDKHSFENVRVII